MPRIKGETEPINVFAPLPIFLLKKWGTQLCCFRRATHIGQVVSGPFFHLYDTWQLVINTPTTQS